MKMKLLLGIILASLGLAKVDVQLSTKNLSRVLKEVIDLKIENKLDEENQNQLQKLEKDTLKENQERKYAGRKLPLAGNLQTPATTMGYPLINPFLNSLTPFKTFGNFNPFVMNPHSFIGFNPGNIAQPGLPAVNLQQKRRQLRRNEVKSLRLDDRHDLKLPGEYPPKMQRAINLEEALNQKELNEQRAYLNGVTSEEWEELKRIDNKAQFKNNV